MRIVDADQVRAAAPMPQLLDAVEAAYRDVAAGRDRSPIRSRIPMGVGDLLLMPGVDGINATARIKAAHPEVEIVAITSFVEEALPSFVC